MDRWISEKELTLFKEMKEVSKEAFISYQPIPGQMALLNFIIKKRGFWIRVLKPSLRDGLKLSFS